MNNIAQKRLNAIVPERLFFDFIDYCSGQEAEHSKVISAIVAGKFNTDPITLGGTCKYFNNIKTTKEFAAEAFAKEFENILLGKNGVYERADFNLKMRCYHIEVLVQFFLDSPNYNINEVIRCMEQFLSNFNLAEIPNEASDVAKVILRHKRCNFSAVKFFINYGGNYIGSVALRHRLSKKLTAFY